MSFGMMAGIRHIPWHGTHPRSLVKKPNRLPLPIIFLCHLVVPPKAVCFPRGLAEQLIHYLGALDQHRAELFAVDDFRCP
jgi:hypothetical protein